MGLLGIKYLNRGLRHWHQTAHPLHRHEGVQVIVALHGSFVVDTTSRKYDVPTSSAIVIPPLVQRGFSSRATVEMLVVISKSLTQPWRSFLVSQNRPKVIMLASQDLSDIESLYRRCHEEVIRDDVASKKILSLLIETWLGVLYRASSRKKSPFDDRLERARVWISSHFSDKIKISDVAYQVGMSESHFRERYHETYGRSPKNEISRLRFLKAQNLLLESNLKLSEIAERCGFCNEHEFSKFFSRSTGIPPGKWRKQT
jgi:AraC-like DNA-binding protein